MPPSTSASRTASAWSCVGVRMNQASVNTAIHPPRQTATASRLPQRVESHPIPSAPGSATACTSSTSLTSAGPSRSNCSSARLENCEIAVCTAPRASMAPTSTGPSGAAVSRAAGRARLAAKSRSSRPEVAACRSPPPSPNRANAAGSENTSHQPAVIAKAARRPPAAVSPRRSWAVTIAVAATSAMAPPA